MSARYLPAVAALLALALVPTVLHGYLGMEATDGRTAAALPMQLNGLDGRPSERSAGWVLDAYGAADFVERQYGPALTLFVARSHDAKRLYHHPELGVARGDGYERATVIRPSDRAEVPIFVLRSAQDRLSMYVLLYKGEFVEHPIRFQLQNALAMLVRPRAQMTLFFVRSRTSLDSPEATSRSAQALLLAAIDSFRAQPGTASP